MLDSIFFFLNGEPVTVRGEGAFMPLAHFLREVKGLTGTKIACGQGACGACTVLLGRPSEGTLFYRTFNSCLLKVFQVHGCHIITVEGLQNQEPTALLPPLHAALVSCHGVQCGYCTPGMVLSMQLAAQADHGGPPETPALWQEALCGNLCRCTGYIGILEAAATADWQSNPTISELYPAHLLLPALRAVNDQSRLVGAVRKVYLATDLGDALHWYAGQPTAQIVAGGSEPKQDLGRKKSPDTFLSLGHLEELKGVRQADGTLRLGAGASWQQVLEKTADLFPELHQFLKRWGAPQLRNAGTVGGSVVAAGPLADSLPFLLACEADVLLGSARGERIVPLARWLEGGVGHLEPGEILTEVLVPLPAAEGAVLRLEKVRHRQAFDRAIISVAFYHDAARGEYRLAVAGLSPHVRRLSRTEAHLREHQGAAGAWPEALAIAQEEVEPRTDGSAGTAYKRLLLSNLLGAWARELST